ncbi:amidase [Collimonas silvisoli]|uniref:amidase n=1 Tax=Collimonas silvisoli TaxID=2825884 RepID=UPI001B8CF9CF|nr:amidase [Collimonas silvisoli]
MISAVQTAALIRTLEISPVEVVRAYIERAREVNGRLNAIVVERFNDALKEARLAEKKALRREPLGALHGLPCTVKEGLGFKGLPQTCGSKLRNRSRCNQDATVVARIRAAGAIVIGLTNQSEMALWPESDNIVYGRTSNPWHRSRTAGGSSGGEAAIVAACGSSFGLGTDGGGSIRIPAAYCGVFGHKPSSGLAPLTGHTPLDEMFRQCKGAQGMAKYFAPGPLTRHAEDLMLVLRVIAGPDGCDLNMESRPRLEPTSSMLNGRRVLVCPEPLLSKDRTVGASAAQAVRIAASALEQRGAVVLPWSDPALQHAFKIWAAIVGAVGGPGIRAMIGQGKFPALAQEILLRSIGRPNHTFPAVLACLSERWMPMRSSTMFEYYSLGMDLRSRLNETLGTDGVLLLPPVSRAAPLHGHTILRPFDIGLCALFNALEMPTTVAPVGMDEKGMPLSVQIVGPHGADHLTLSVALELECALGGWRMPPTTA